MGFRRRDVVLSNLFQLYIQRRATVPLFFLLPETAGGREVLYNSHSQLTLTVRPRLSLLSLLYLQ